MVVEDALHISEKRREVKSKGEKNGYTQLNEELQRIAYRDKKAFFSKQCREIEKNNRIRMGKTGDLVKEIKYQGNISCKDEHNTGQKQHGPNRSGRY